MVILERDDAFVKQLIKKLADRRKYNNVYNDVNIKNTVSISDILPTNCMRKQAYMKKFPEMIEPTIEGIFYVTRGKASEHVLTKMANMGVSQERMQREGIVGYPDILGNTVIELKDTTVGDRLHFNNSQFRGYMLQLLYNMVITESEVGILAINYNVKEIIWDHKDSQGKSWFYRPLNPKGVGIEAWRIFMAKDDYARQLLWSQMIERKEYFLQAIHTDNFSMLPRVKERDRNFRCHGCPFYQKCWNEDDETDEARAMTYARDILDIDGFVRVL
jgi:hypothetical protein